MGHFDSIVHALLSEYSKRPSHIKRPEAKEFLMDSCSMLFSDRRHLFDLGYTLPLAFGVLFGNSASIGKRLMFMRGIAVDADQKHARITLENIRYLSVNLPLLGGVSNPASLIINLNSASGKVVGGATASLSGATELNVRSRFFSASEELLGFFRDAPPDACLVH